MEWETFKNKCDQVYYFNKKTGATTFVKPNELKSTVELSLPSADWIKYVYRDGIAYYTNHTTNESRWEEPPEFKLQEMRFTNLTHIKDAFVSKAAAESLKDLTVYLDENSPSYATDRFVKASSVTTTTTTSGSGGGAQHPKQQQAVTIATTTAPPPLSKRKQKLGFLLKKSNCLVYETSEKRKHLIPSMVEALKNEFEYCKNSFKIAIVSNSYVLLKSIRAKLIQTCLSEEEIGAMIHNEEIRVDENLNKVILFDCFNILNYILPMLGEFSVIILDFENDAFVYLLLGILKRLFSNHQENKEKNNELLVKLVIVSRKFEYEHLPRELLEYFKNNKCHVIYNDGKQQQQPRDGNDDNNNNNNKQTEEEINNEYLQRFARIREKSSPLAPSETQFAYLKSSCENYVNLSVDLVFELMLKEKLARVTNSGNDILVLLANKKQILDALQVFPSQLQLFLQDKRLLNNNNNNNADGMVVKYFGIFKGMSKESLHSYLSPSNNSNSNNVKKVFFCTFEMINQICKEEEVDDGLLNVSYLIDCMYDERVVFDSNYGCSIIANFPVLSLEYANRRSSLILKNNFNRKCIRLVEEKHFFSKKKNSLVQSGNKEIADTCVINLSSVLLMMRYLGVKDVVRFPWFRNSNPSENAFVRGFHELFSMEALDKESGMITKLGEFLRLLLPINVQLSRVLYYAHEKKCFDEVLTIIALLLTGEGYKLLNSLDEALKRIYSVQEGDLLSLLNYFYAYDHLGKRGNGLFNAGVEHVKKMKTFLRKKLLKFLPMVENYNDEAKLLRERDLLINNIGGEQRGGAKSIKTLREEEKEKQEQEEYQIQILKCFAYGFFANVARYDTREGCYKTVRENKRIVLHSNSVISKFKLLPSYVIYYECVIMPGYSKDLEVTPIARIVSKIDVEVLMNVNQSEFYF